MQKTTKVLLGILLILVLIIIYFSNKEIKQEHIINAHKVVDSIENTYLDINKTKYKVKKSLEKVFDSNTSNKYTKNDILTIESEEVFDVTESDLKSFQDEALYNFIKEFPDKVEYFKVDFEPIFDKKVGSEVQLIISGEEYTGFIKDKSIDYSQQTFDESKGEYVGPKKGIMFVDLTLIPNINDDERISKQINISGTKESDTKFEYRGSLEYSRINSIEDKDFRINNSIGVLYPQQAFQAYISKNIGLCDEGFYSIDPICY